VVVQGDDSSFRIKSRDSPLYFTPRFAVSASNARNTSTVLRSLATTSSKPGLANTAPLLLLLVATHSFGMRGQQQKNACCHLAAGRRLPLLEATHKHSKQANTTSTAQVIVTHSFEMCSQQQKNACCHLAAGRRLPLLEATHKHSKQANTTSTAQVVVTHSFGMRGQQQKNACCHLAAGRRLPLLEATHKHSKQANTTSTAPAGRDPFI
jgi:hypothetical protein